nr:hypothetical protein [uncultured archaeon]
MAEYANDLDEYWDLQHFGLIDKMGRKISHQEQHEFMIGYPDEPSIKSKQDDLDAIILASLSASISSLVATTSI